MGKAVCQVKCVLDKRGCRVLSQCLFVSVDYLWFYTITFVATSLARVPPSALNWFICATTTLSSSTLWWSDTWFTLTALALSPLCSWIICKFAQAFLEQVARCPAHHFLHQELVFINIRLFYMIGFVNFASIAPIMKVASLVATFKLLCISVLRRTSLTLFFPRQSHARLSRPHMNRCHRSHIVPFHNIGVCEPNKVGSNLCHICHMLRCRRRRHKEWVHLRLQSHS